MSVRHALMRELRVAVSRKAQPMGFRVLKWAIAIGLVAYFRRAPHVWWWVAGALALGLIVHLVWRTKTKGWTQPWGGWNDLDATRDVPRRE